MSDLIEGYSEDYVDDLKQEIARLEESVAEMVAALEVLTTTSSNYMDGATTDSGRSPSGVAMEALKSHRERFPE